MAGYYIWSLILITSQPHVASVGTDVLQFKPLAHAAIGTDKPLSVTSAFVSS